MRTETKEMRAAILGKLTQEQIAEIARRRGLSVKDVLWGGSGIPSGLTLSQWLIGVHDYATDTDSSLCACGCGYSAEGCPCSGEDHDHDMHSRWTFDVFGVLRTTGGYTEWR